MQTTTRHRIAVSVMLAGSLLASGAAMAQRNGMTWGKLAHDDELGLDHISCHGLPAAPSADGACDAYTGDTSCAQALPLLCVKVDDSRRPNYALKPGASASQMGWARGHVATTLPVVGSELANPRTNPDDAATGDNRCQAAFGEGWRMAEFHDGRYVKRMNLDVAYGNQENWHSTSPWPANSQRTSRGGWSFLAFGDVRSDTRYWVRIEDQPANCWGR